MSKLKTAIYCRIGNPSPPNDIPAILQRESLVSYAKERGYKNIECYEDIGFNGRAFDNRPSFQKLQADIDAGKVRRVIAKSESRIGRNIFDVSCWSSTLQAKGVEFITPAHPALPVDILQKMYEEGTAGYE